MESGGWYDDEYRNDEVFKDAESGRESEQAVPQQQAPQALRLTFRFDGESVELAEIQQLRKLIPPMVGEPPEEGRHYGEWIELRDGDDRVLFTRVLNDPLQTRVEVHNPDTGPSIVVGPPGQGTFDVVVPDLREATSAVLFASTPGRGKRLRRAAPIARFDLHRRPNDESRPDQGGAS
jgi:hypothetical protein